MGASYPFNERDYQKCRASGLVIGMMFEKLNIPGIVWSTKYSSIFIKADIFEADVANTTRQAFFVPILLFDL